MAVYQAHPNIPTISWRSSVRKIHGFAQDAELLLRYVSSQTDKHSLHTQPCWRQYFASVPGVTWRGYAAVTLPQFRLCRSSPRNFTRRTVSSPPAISRPHEAYDGLVESDWGGRPPETNARHAGDGSGTDFCYRRRAFDTGRARPTKRKYWSARRGMNS